MMMLLLDVLVVSVGTEERDFAVDDTLHQTFPCLAIYELTFLMPQVVLDATKLQKALLHPCPSHAGNEIAVFQSPTHKILVEAVHLNDVSLQKDMLQLLPLSMGC